jgi:hypothetical protein
MLVDGEDTGPERPVHAVQPGCANTKDMKKSTQGGRVLPGRGAPIDRVRRNWGGGDRKG